MDYVNPLFHDPLLSQIMIAVDYCHRKGICNRDIKLENILLEKNRVSRDAWPALASPSDSFSLLEDFDSLKCNKGPALS
jgi:serine/threonine protein kinase